MDMKISGDEYNCSYLKYLRTGQNSLTDEKSTAESGIGFSETAAVYEKGESYDFGTYSADSVQTKTLPESALNSKMKTYLNALGFYDGEMGGSYTESFKTALKCFQKAYFGTVMYSVNNKVVDKLKEKIESVGTAYYTNLLSDKTAEALKKLGFIDPTAERKQNFARIQTFLEKGMGCTKYQVAGIMGNIMQECRFNPMSKNDDALGILQWKGNRRIYLDDFAQKNGCSSENIGLQFAYFRYEVSSKWGTDCLGRYAENSEIVEGWNTIKNDYKYNFYMVSDIFQDKIESCPHNQQERRDYSSMIYQAIC